MNRSLIFDDRYEEHRQKVHEEKLKSIKSTVDNSSPPTFSHLSSRRKQKQIASDRNGEITRSNEIMTKKLEEISSKPSRIAHRNPNYESFKHSLNRDKRQKELDRIAAENYAFVKRMIENPPSYATVSYEEEQEKQLKYLKNSAKFPVLDHHLVKDPPKKPTNTKELVITLSLTPPKLNKSPPNKKKAKTKDESSSSDSDSNSKSDDDQ